MKNGLISFALLAVVGLPLMARSAPTSADRDSIEFGMEAASFAIDTPNTSRLDLYVKVVYAELQFLKPTKDEFLATYKVTAEIFNSDNERVKSREVEGEATVSNLDEANSTDRFDLIRLNFGLPPGEYSVVVTLKDLETRYQSRKQQSITVKDYSKDSNFVSDLLLVDHISKNESGEIVVRPRISKTISEDIKLSAFFEVYDVSPEDSFKISSEVSKSGDGALWTNEKWRKGEGRTTQNFIVIQGDSLMHGDYVVRVAVEHGDQVQELKMPLKWHIEGLPLAFADLDKAIEVLKYIAPEDEYERLKNLDDDEMYREYKEFWKQRDPTPGTAENELRSEYYQRILYANKNYKGVRREGWKTDMGWAYVMLGEPDIIEREPYSQGILRGKSIKSVEIWVYYKYSKQLVFLDENGFGDYRLENPETLYEMLR